MIKGMVPASNGGWECPTDICKAACCRGASWSPQRPAPCEFLRSDHGCQMHVEGGMAGKPGGCASYPRDQADIDAMNAGLERAGIAERCQLRFE